MISPTPVRKMMPGDVGEIARIEQSYPSPWSLPSLHKELSRPNSIQLVACTDTGLLYGWLCASIVGSEAELLKITISSSCRRKGVGTLLLSHLEQDLKVLEVDSLFLEVRSQNDTALKFYLKFGFFQVGLRRKYYSLPDDDAVILKKNI